MGRIAGREGGAVGRIAGREGGAVGRIAGREGHQTEESCSHDVADALQYGILFLAYLRCQQLPR